MDGDAVGASQLGQHRRMYGVGFGAAAGLANRRHVVEPDAEPQHVRAVYRGAAPIPPRGHGSGPWGRRRKTTPGATSGLRPRAGLASVHNPPVTRASALPPQSLRARKQQLVSAAIRRAAWELFTRRGYETTTVEEIAAAAGVSRRTVFRHYASKEDVVVGTFDALVDEYVEAVSQRPTREPPFVSIEHALVPVLASRVADPDAGRAIIRLMRESPGLSRARLDRLARIEDRLTTLFARRLHLDPARDCTPALLGFVARAMADAAFNVWFDQGGREPAGLVAELFAGVADLARSRPRRRASTGRRGSGPSRPARGSGRAEPTARPRPPARVRRG